MTFMSRHSKLLLDDVLFLHLHCQVVKCQIKFSNNFNFLISEQKHQVCISVVFVEMKGTF